MRRKYGNTNVLERYATPFRRELSGLMRALNQPHAKLEKVIVKSRHTGDLLFVAIAARAYEHQVSCIKKHNQSTARTQQIPD